MAETELVVGEILRTSEEAREVRFRFAHSADTTSQYRMNLVRSNDGWSVASYGPNTVGLVAAVVRGSTYAMYQDLLEPLDQLTDARHEWYSAQLDANIFADVLHNAPPRAELEQHLSPDSAWGDALWGVHPEDVPIVIWVRDAADSTRVCAIAYAEPDYSSEFGWLASGSGEVRDERCRGDAAPYEGLFDDIEERIVANGNIWLD